VPGEFDPDEPEQATSERHSAPARTLTLSLIIEPAYRARRPRVSRVYAVCYLLALPSPSEIGEEFTAAHEPLLAPAATNRAV
jgi:hypothetical protein